MTELFSACAFACLAPKTPSRLGMQNPIHKHRFANPHGWYTTTSAHTYTSPHGSKLRGVLLNVIMFRIICKLAQAHLNDLVTKRNIGLT